MSKILAIETATEACSAALLNGEAVSVRYELAPREHTQLLLPMMDEVLAQAGVALKEIDAVAFSRGPGAFTGLRISAGVAQGAALSVDVPVIPVSTLAALANQIDVETGVIIAALDARMGEVYWGVFDKKGAEISLQGEEQVSKPEEMFERANQLIEKYKMVYAIGPGWDEYQADMPSALVFTEKALPSAKDIATLALALLQAGETVAAEDAQPIYIRNNVAIKKR